MWYFNGTFKPIVHSIKYAPKPLNTQYKDMFSTVLQTDPTTLDQTFNSPDSSKWKESINQEFDSLIKNGTLQKETTIKYLSTDKMVTDMFTQPLCAPTFEKHRDALGMGSALST